MRHRSWTSTLARLFAVALVGTQLVLVSGAPTAGAAPELFAEYPVPGARNLFDITPGPDGNQWFAEFASNNIGRITPDGTVTRFSMSGAAQRPMQITAGLDGALWFIGRGGFVVNRITTGGAVTTVTLPGFPFDVAAGPAADGRVWVTLNSGKLGAVTPGGVVSEYNLPPSTSPYSLTAGPDGGIWFTTQGGQVGRMNTDGTGVALYPVSGLGSSAVITDGPDGNLWFTKPATSAIGRISPAGVITSYPLSTEEGSLQDITAGTDGGVWFTMTNANKIARIAPDGSIAEILVKTPGSGPWGISAGPGGAVWFNESRVSQVAVFTPPASGPLVGSVVPGFADPVGGTTVKISGLSLAGATAVSFGATPATSFVVDNQNQITAVTPVGAEGLEVEVVVTTSSGSSGPAPGSRFLFTTFVEYQTGSFFLRDITAGPDGNLWFASYGPAGVGRLTPAGEVTEFPTPTPDTNPAFMTPAPPGGGTVWFGGNRLGRVEADGSITERFTGSNVEGITLGPDANIWFTKPQLNKVSRVTPAGVETDFDLPANSIPGPIVSGSDGALWFGMDGRDGKLGRITTAGAITEFDFPVSDTQLRGMALGPDGNVWYAMRSGPRIGRVTPAGDIDEFLLPDRGMPVENDYTIDIAAGPDGAMWYTRPQSNVVGRITTDGLIGEFVVPTPTSFPSGITAGPGDGKVWFTLEGTGRIGSMNAAALPLSPPEVRRVVPPTGPTTGGTAVTAVGVNLAGATAVTFGGVPAASFASVPGHAGRLTAVSPPHALGPVDLDVTTPQGSATGTFVYSAKECGQVITQSTNLKADIGPCYGAGVIVGADNVTLDLKGKRIFGFPGPSDGTSAGVSIVGRHGVRLRSGTVSGFDAGVMVDGGGGHILSGLQILDNIGPDDPFNAELGDGIILFNSVGSTISGNSVLRNGIFDGIGVLGPESANNSIKGNLVEDTKGSSDGGPAGQGIIVNASLDVSVGGKLVTANNVMDNVVRRSGSAGIANVNVASAVISGNLVERNGATNAAGNGIGLTFGETPASRDSGMTVKNNVVRNNGEHGIQVLSNANRIVANVFADNSTKFPNFKDMFDAHPDCGTNVWKANTWGSAGFSPACTSAGGSGPAPGSASLASAARTAGETPEGTTGAILRRRPAP